MTTTATRDEKLQWIYDVALGKHGGDECVDWPWATNSKGYGHIRWQGPVTKVGHIVLELTDRPRPVGAQQMHSCHRAICVNPRHLAWGTATEVVAEQVERRRARADELHETFIKARRQKGVGA